jgi:hypothetical protein
MSELGATTAKAAVVTKTVKIFPGNPPTVSEDPVSLSKSKNEEVAWTCSEKFTVTMEGTSPFVSQHFTQSTNHSGVPILTPDAGVSLSFKYSVEVGGHIADPGIIINK